MLDCTPYPAPSVLTPATDAERHALEIELAHLEAEEQAEREEFLRTVGAFYDEAVAYGSDFISTPLRLIRALCALADDPMAPGCTREFADATLELVSELESDFDESDFERPSALLRAALNNQHEFGFSIEEARRAHPGLSDLEAVRHTALDRIREQRYAAWDDGPAE